MKEIIYENKDIISNADFILDLLDVVLKNSIMQFQEEFFQQMFADPKLAKSRNDKTGEISQRKMFSKPKTSKAIILCQIH